MKKLLLIILLLKTALLSVDFITLGTGEMNATYYPTGQFLCKFINKNTIKNNINCSVESSDGSIYNIIAVDKGYYQFAISQSDTIYQAINGIGKFSNKSNTELRSVIGLYSELFTLVTRKDANINHIDDLKGKRINLGNAKSGTGITTLALFKEYGLSLKDLSFFSSLEIADTEDALIDNRIDAYFFMVGHPTNNIKNAAISTPISIIPIAGKEIDNLINRFSFFSKDFIPANLYKDVNNSIPTFSVKAVLITSSNVSEKVVYNFTKAIVENLEEFKKLHPAYKNITKESLFQGLSAPLHKGAKRYYKEIGLL